MDTTHTTPPLPHHGGGAHSAPKETTAMTRAILLLVPTIGMGLLYAAYMVYLRFGPQRVREGTSDRRVRTSPNKFRLATSLLDTQGNLVIPWQPAPARLGERLHEASAEASRGGSKSQLSGADGWFNFAVVYMLLYVVSTALYNYITLGSIFSDQGAYASELLRYVPELVRDWTILCLVYAFATYGHQLLVVHGFMGRRVAILLQAVVEVGMLVGCVVYARTQPKWPITQRAGWLIQMAVLLMKMHSYIVTNRHLKMELDSGGPGTGAIILHLQHKEFKQTMEKAEQAVAASTTQPQPRGKDTPAASESSGKSTGVQLSANGAASGEEMTSPRRRRRSVGRAAASPLAAAATAPAVEARTNGGVRPADSVPALAAFAAQAGNAPPIAAPQPLRERGDSSPSSQAAGAPGGPDTRSPWQRAWQSIVRSFREEFSTRSMEAAAGRGAGSGAVYPYALNASNMWSDTPAATPAVTPAVTPAGGTDTAATASARGVHAAPPSVSGTAVPLRASLSSHIAKLQEHASEAHRWLGKVVYGINYEGEVVQTGVQQYPNNVNIRDFMTFSFAPVLCYEPNYPRTTHIRPSYLAEKAFLAAGLLVTGMYVMSHYILPVLNRVNHMTELEACLKLLAPLSGMVLLFFFVCFECVLNGFAELTYFGDRETYEDFWNSTTFLEFSRKWNTPVHNWLLRHVYLDSMRQTGISAGKALVLTFLVSIVLHEVLLWGVFGLVTPWLAVFSLLQLPLGRIQRIGFIKGKRLGNSIFWAGLMIGITIIVVMYSKEYYANHPISSS